MLQAPVGTQTDPSEAGTRAPPLLGSVAVGSGPEVTVPSKVSTCSPKVDPLTSSMSRAAPAGAKARNPQRKSENAAKRPALDATTMRRDHRRSLRPRESGDLRTA